MTTQNRTSRRAINLLARMSALLILATLSVPLGGCEIFSSLGPANNTQTELVSFSSCNALETYIKGQAIRELGLFDGASSLGANGYQPMGFATNGGEGGSGSNPDAPPVAELPFDETNLQEQGIDEADIFKVDSTHVYALRGQQLIILTAEADAPAQKLSRLDFNGEAIEMFLQDDRLVIITRQKQSEVAVNYLDPPKRAGSSKVVKVVVVDISDRAAPRIEREVAVDGEYVAARRIGDQVHVVARALLGVSDSTDADADADDSGGVLHFNQLSILGADLDSWLPFYYDTSFNDDGTSERSSERADCESTYHATGTPGEDALGVFSFNLADPKSEIHTTTILGDGGIVYASSESVIVALTNYGSTTYDGAGEGGFSTTFDDFGFGEGGEAETSTTSEGEKTYLHRFALTDDGRTEYDATGEVDGWILNQFSISEHKGYVRVATQRERGTSNAESMVFVMKAGAKTSTSSTGGILHAAPTQAGDAKQSLSVVGELRGIALDEDLYATRFQGDVGYLITFRETDPLWTLDLSNPTSPKILGELMVPGYSTYLHPISQDRLLAIGRGDWWDDEGIKVSLFDVSDLSNPIAVYEETFGDEDSDSEAITEHRAFRYIPDQNLLAIPMKHRSEQGLYLYRVNDRSLESLGRVDHSSMGDATPRRAYRIGEHLYGFSEDGVSVTTMSNAQVINTVPFL